MAEDLREGWLEEVIRGCDWVKRRLGVDGAGTLPQVSIEDAVPKGFNYSGCLLRATLRTAGGPPLCLVLKLLPRTSDQIQFVQQHGLFRSETRIYDDVLTALESLIESKGLRQDVEWPLHYTISSEDFLVLQDLKEEGFITVKEREATEEEGVMVVRVIARLHALSLSLLAQHKLNVSHYSVNHMVMNSTIVNFVYISTLRAIVDALKSLSTSTPSWRSLGDKLEKNINKTERAVNALWQRDNGEVITQGCHVLNHGDCWLNNIMFRHDENGHPQSVKLIDFQLCYYGNQAWDLVHFIYCSYLPSSRQRLLPLLLSEYCVHLDQHLKLLGLEDMCRTACDLEGIRDQMERIKLFGLLVGVCTAPRLMGSGATLDLDITRPDHAHLSKTAVYSRPAVFDTVSADLQSLTDILNAL